MPATASRYAEHRGGMFRLAHGHPLEMGRSAGVGRGRRVPACPASEQRGRGGGPALLPGLDRKRVLALRSVLLHGGARRQQRGRGRRRCAERRRPPRGDLVVGSRARAAGSRPGPLRPRCSGLRRERRRRHRRDDADAHEHPARLHHDRGGDDRPRHARRRLEQGDAINNHDQVVGEADAADGSPHAFLWSPGSGMRDLGTLGGFGSHAFAVNDAGEVVGFADPTSNQLRAFRWRNGRMTMLAGIGRSRELRARRQ